MTNRRKTPDRRANDHKQDIRFGCNRRYRADRRLNSIQVEWIAFDEVKLHPVTRLFFSRD